MDIEQIVSIIPRRVHEWNQKDVEVWLTYIQLPQLIPKFKPHRVDGKKLLKLTFKDLLTTYSIESNIIKKKILNWIQYLGESMSNCQKHAKVFRLIDTPQIVRRSNKFDDFLSHAQTSDEDSFQVARSQKSTLTREIIKKDSNTSKYSYIPNHESLYIYERCYNQNKFYVCDQTSITFGRSNQNSFCIIDNDVQADHCAIIHRQNHHYLISSDRNSGAWIKITKRFPIRGTCIIQMGELDFHITVYEATLQIMIQSVGSQMERHTFDGRVRQSVRVGRRNNCDIIKPQDTTLSGYHGKFIFDDEQWSFEDLQTTNGSWLRCLDETLIVDKMIFRIGRSNYIYQSRIWENQECKSVSSNASSQLGTCRNCRNSDKNCYFKPCHHNQYCFSCAIFMKECPVCNTKIRKVEKIYKN